MELTPQWVMDQVPKDGRYHHVTYERGDFGQRFMIDGKEVRQPNKYEFTFVEQTEPWKP